MNINKYIKNIWVAACILMGGTLFNSCTDELDGKSVINTGTEGINLTISVDGMREKVLTRVTSERKDKSEIHDLHIILASGDKDEDEILDVLSVENMEEGSSLSEDLTGLVSDPLSNDDDDDDDDEIIYQYHISQEKAKRASHVYVVANYMNEDGELVAFPKDEISTVSDLKTKEVGFPATSSNPYCTMFGEVALGSNTDAHGHSNGSTYSVELKRTLAMITVGIDCRGEDGSNSLHKGVMITPTSIALKNVPEACVLGANNKPTSVVEGESYSNLGWATLTSDRSQAFTPDEPHSKNPDVIPLFMCENMQGTDSSIDNDDETKKDNESTNSKYATYIEVKADYEYHKESDDNPVADNPNILRGTITYKFYLGENEINNFDVKRNVHYQLTLCLKDWAGLKEDGKIGSGDIYVEEVNPDVSWRVDTDLKKIDDGQFIDDVIDIPVAGCRFNVTVAADNMDDIRFHRGSYDGLFVRNPRKQWINISAGDMSAKKDIDVLDNKDGTYTCFFYAKPLMDFSEKAGNLKTEQDWVDNGYEEFSSAVYLKIGGQQYPLNVRRWYPLPVMDPADLNGSTNPNNAKLYYSRFDIANGEELSWGPSAYNSIELNSEGPDHGQLVVENLNITDPYGGTGYRDFNPKYGFHNQVAFFKTVQSDGNEDALNFSAVINDNTYDESNYGTYTIMDFAIFTSANAEEPDLSSEGTDDVIVSVENVKHQHRYALASKEEWEKIEKYGAKDPNHSVLPVPYWTSNMEGTQSYVYIYGSGGKTDLRDRSEPYRGRMVYHINNDAEF